MLASIEPVDRAIRRLRRSDEILALQRQVESGGAGGAGLGAPAAPDGASPTGDTGPAGPAPGLASVELPSLSRFVTWAEPGHFYSPVPDLAEIEQDADRLFEPRDELVGVDLRVHEQLATFRTLAALAREDPLPETPGPGPGARYGLANPNYGIGDASMLKAVLRHLRPTRYLEVGSGWSTALALDTSEQHLGGQMSVTAIEPYPELLYSLLRPGDPVEVIAERVQRVPLARFAALEANDVLFIDSSHVLKTGSDVHFLFTNVLPVLAPGVHVHIHDVFWPFEYLRHWIEEGRAWNECYLVHAFLAFNSCFEIVLFNHYLAQCHREVIGEELPAMLENTGGALWMRRAAE